MSISGPSAASSISLNGSVYPANHFEEADWELAETLLILYASETGNAQDCAERLGREVRRKSRRCVIMGMDEFDIVSPTIRPEGRWDRAHHQLELPSTPLVVFITSTHGRGDPPPAMMPLWSALLRGSLPQDILEGV